MLIFPAWNFEVLMLVRFNPLGWNHRDTFSNELLCLLKAYWDSRVEFLPLVPFSLARFVKTCTDFICLVLVSEKLASLFFVLLRLEVFLAFALPFFDYWRVESFIGIEDTQSVEIYIT